MESIELELDVDNDGDGDGDVDEEGVSSSQDRFNGVDIYRDIHQRNNRAAD